MYAVTPVVLQLNHLHEVTSPNEDGDNFFIEALILGIDRISEYEFRNLRYLQKHKSFFITIKQNSSSIHPF